MPTYNTAKYIKKAIESVLNQTYYNLELIIVNDGSTDNTSELVLAINDKRIKYFELEVNKGRGFARNYAISKCSGEYIAICDADDISLPDRIKLQVQFFDNNEDIDILGTQLLHFYDKSSLRKVYHYPESPAAIERWYNKGVMGVAHASCMLRKRCFIQMKYEDKMSYVEDFELFLRLNKYYKMASLSKCLVLYRNDLSNVTWSRIRYHSLYHDYSIYQAKCKLSGIEFIHFNEWSKSIRKNFTYLILSLIMYAKIKVKYSIKYLGS